MYQITVTAHKGDTISVEAELLESGERWRGDFSSKYIEDITTKTGNFKKYSVFVKMLFSSLGEDSSSVFLDLLTYEDLESLKSRAGAGSSRASTRAPPAAGNKRYVILTYAAEFDRVHYPLPLLYEDNPDPQMMRETILKLRQEIQGLKGTRSMSSTSSFSLKAENRHLREENGSLKAQMQRAIRNQKGDSFDEVSTQLKLVKRERDLLQARLEALEDDLEGIRISHRKLLKKKEREYVALADENAKYRASNRELRSKNRALESELDVLRSKRHRVRSASPRLTTNSRGSYLANSNPPSRSTSQVRSRGSRGSRGPSPYTSRDASPTVSRPPSGASSRQSSVERGRSKTPRKRFDPTAYVMEQRAKLEARRNKTKTFTPSSSRPTSRNNSRPNSRASSGRSTPSSQAKPKATSQAQARPRTARKRLPLSNESSFVQPKRSTRDDSPGRVLHDVQTKLDEYVNKQREKIAQSPNAKQFRDENKIQRNVSAQSPGKKIFNDATAEIADIDTRLQALQHFLSNVRVDGKPPN